MIERLREKLRASELGRSALRFANLATLWNRSRPTVGATPADVVHAENKWRLLRYRSSTPVRFATPVLMVPSLINRHYVLDLAPGRSMVEWLVNEGHDVFMIDWGRPGPEDRYLTLDEIIDGYLGRAVRLASRDTGRVHLLGYCLGGTLAAIYAAAERKPARVASLLALAAPVRFAPAGVLAHWVRSPDFDVEAMIDAYGNVPWQAMQFAFQMLRPTLLLSKTVHMLDRAWDNEFLDGFFALETWGNDNVSFPGRAFGDYVGQLYRDDALVNGTLMLAGRPAHLPSITQPLLVVSFAHDNIVPATSATPLHELASSADKELLQLSGGHVGAVVARKAATTLWPRLAKFWADR